MTTKREYPFTAWILKPSFKPVQVEIVGSYYITRHDYHESEKGRVYHNCDLFWSKDEAICVGRSRLADQEAVLAKRAATIAKKRAALDKAEREA